METRKEKMKAIIFNTLVFITILAGTAGAAHSGQKEGVIVDVQEVYASTPQVHYETQCYNQEVPVYGVRNGSAGDVFAGAVIGGAIGNQFGNGNGKDAMTALGALVGMGVANQPRREVVGYDYQQICENVEVVDNVYSFSHYEVTYAVGDKLFTINTTEPFYVGEFVVVK